MTLAFDIDHDDLPTLRKKCIARMGERWKDFKSKLSRDYVFGKLKLCNPRIKHTFISEGSWKGFRAQKLADQASGLRDKSSHVPEKHAPRYRKSRAGYSKLTQVIMKKMFEQGVWEAMELGMNEDEARNTVEYPRPQDVPRYEKWLRAHSSNNGPFKGFHTQQALDIATNIREYQQKARDGEFFSVGKEDLLAKGLGKVEHPGRVRGVGTLACHRDVFPKHKQSKAPSSNSQCKQIASLTTTLYEVTQIALLALKTAGLEVPQRFAHLGVVGKEDAIRINRSRPMDATPPTKETPRDDNKVEGVQRCNLKIDGGQVVAEGELHNNIRTHHGKKIDNDSGVVVVVNSIDSKALLPCPESEAKTVGDSSLMFLVWPLRLVEIKDAPIEPITPINVGGKAKEISGGLKKVKKAKYVKINPKRRDEFEDGCVRQIAFIIKDHPSDSTYQIHFDREIFGSEFDLKFCKDMIEEFCRNEEMITAPIIQLHKMFLHMLANELSKEWIGFLDPYRIQGGCTTTEIRLAHISSCMMSTKKLMYLAPFFENNHWMVALIVLPSNTVYWFDPVHEDPRESFLHDIEKVLTDPHITKHKEVHWKSLKHKKQASFWECGYYCMRFMWECVQKVTPTNFQLHEEYFVEDKSPYTSNDLDETREIFTSFMMRKHLPSFFKPFTG